MEKDSYHLCLPPASGASRNTKCCEEQRASRASTLAAPQRTLPLLTLACTGFSPQVGHCGDRGWGGKSMGSIRACIPDWQFLSSGAPAVYLEAWGQGDMEGVSVTTLSGPG